MSDATRRDALVRDVARLAREAPRELTASVAKLSLGDQVEVVLRLAGRERLELLLHAPQPMRLVRSLPGMEIYLTAREVGPFDSIPLLALASADQLLHVIDLEAFRGDRFDADRAGAWVALFLEAGEPALLRFLRIAEDELLAFLFHAWVRVREIEDPEEPADGIVSPDGAHYFDPTIPEHAPAIQRIAEILLHDDQNRYARILRLAEWELPSELEETTLRWRNSRLEERGFPDLDSALAVYGAPAGLRHDPATPAAGEDASGAPRTALRARESAPQVVAYLESLPAPLLDRVLFEATSVANRILVADHGDTGDPAAHRAAMERAVAFVGLALAARGVTTDAEAGRVLAAVPVLELFREGFTPAAELQAQARSLMRDGWPKLHVRAMETLDAQLRGTVAALLQRRPLLFDPSAAQGFREFRSPSDLDAASLALAQARLLGQLVTGVLGWDLPRMLESLATGTTPPTLGALWITSIARHDATGELSAGPISPSMGRAFREKLRGARQAESVSDAFLARLPGSGALRAYTLERLAGLALDNDPALIVGAS